MSAITIRFTCGHLGELNGTSDTAPTCAECGEATIRRVKARAPRFRGACSGPYATYEALGAVPVSLATQGPLTLKPQE